MALRRTADATRADTMSFYSGAPRRHLLPGIKPQAGGHHGEPTQAPGSGDRLRSLAEWGSGRRGGASPPGRLPARHGQERPSSA
ncbi:hypothetical protein HVIM_04210 [Roseomonas mucosa]|uniref:Uncharacterized protein n=1 Tax=Roseomonas mucosa TaxID=207340 RepID=A0A4Y1MUJ2_9PROT|nr:hypothetical protein RADP37_04210 [Roseomonas mucosa]QDD93748.1 hypothetical protein HVIM_04210 [Roseomonas mucosa]QDD98852.1 hypothetical protein ADP8_04210 [Roseomonas mucosa]